jgi:hypothetical protein
MLFLFHLVIIILITITIITIQYQHHQRSWYHRQCACGIDMHVKAATGICGYSSLWTVCHDLLGMILGPAMYFPCEKHPVILARSNKLHSLHSERLLSVTFPTQRRFM